MTGRVGIRALGATAVAFLTSSACACGGSGGVGDSDGDVHPTDEADAGDVGFDRTWEAYEPPDVPDNCDPFTSEGCEPGYHCYLGTPSYCLPLPDGGGQAPGETCGAGCAVGAGCYMVAGHVRGYCLKYCRLEGGLPDCSDLPWTFCKPSGHPIIGYCYPPVPET
ncbi:MAG: hypothetical protein JXB32_07110 [Deltaproteobacteria bacterium]|nr:hypothetical protein [Deltaproteobacteria bacterium]